MILVSKSSIIGKSPDHLCSSENLYFMVNNSLMEMSRSRSIAQQTYVAAGLIELRLIPLCPRQRLGRLQRLFARQRLRPQPPACDIIEIIEFGFSAVDEPDFRAAGLRHNLVPDGCAGSASN